MDQATFNIPLTALKCLYRKDSGKKIVCEIDTDSLKKVNEPNTVEEMFAEARLEYFAGKTKGFNNTENLMRDLSHDDYKKWTREV